jgi:hypothetical protein
MSGPRETVRLKQASIKSLGTLALVRPKMEHIRIASCKWIGKKQKTGSPVQDSLVLMAGMVSFRRRLVKNSAGAGDRENKGNTIGMLDSRKTG